MHPLPATLPGGFRALNAPIAAADPLSGDLLVVWNDQLLGDADVLAVRSSDGGDNWSTPVRVNDDPAGRTQCFPWLTFDAGGVAHAIWYDRRQDGTNLDVYYATSGDGGATWSANLRLTAESFAPILPWDTSVAFLGDYNAIAAAGGRVYPFYQDSREGNQDVWVAVISSNPDALFSDGFESGDTTAWSTTVP